MEEDNEKAVTIFGKNIAEIPCFRNSYFYGIWSGIAGGIGYFMFTSKPAIASHFGMATFCISTLTFWTYCRWKVAEQKNDAIILKRYLEERILKEGTKSDPNNDIKIITV